ncbi:MAG: hypothetical protein R6U88_06720 [Candidatus Bipolaricaulota bacterium]
MGTGEEQRARRLRMVGAVAYAAAAFLLLSTLFGVLTGTLAAEDGLTVDPATIAMTIVWLAVLLLPLWAVRWVHPDRMVRTLVAAFVGLLVLAEFSGVGYTLWGGEDASGVAVLAVSAVLSLAQLAVGLFLGVLLWRRPDGLQGLHIELSWALIAYALLSAAWLALPEVLLPLSGVALTVVYIGLGIILRRAAVYET